MDELIVFRRTIHRKFSIRFQAILCRDEQFIDGKSGSSSNQRNEVQIKQEKHSLDEADEREIGENDTLPSPCGIAEDEPEEEGAVPESGAATATRHRNAGISRNGGQRNRPGTAAAAAAVMTMQNGDGEAASGSAAEREAEREKEQKKALLDALIEVKSGEDVMPIYCVKKF